MEKKRSSLATQEPDLPPLQSYPTLGPSSDDRPNCLIASPYDACESCDTLRQHYAVKLPIYDKVVVYSCRVSSSLYIYFNIHISSSSLILFVHAYMLVLQGRKRGGGKLEIRECVQRMATLLHAYPTMLLISLWPTALDHRDCPTAHPLPMTNPPLSRILRQSPCLIARLTEKKRPKLSAFE